MKEKKHSVDWDLVKEETISWVKHIRSSENSRYKETQQANWMAAKSFERMEPYLRDSDSPLSWLVENVPQELLPEVIAYWITTKFADRELISQLKHNGMGYDYTPLIAPLSSADMKKQDIIVQKKINVFNEAIGSLEQTFNPINEMIALIDGFEKHRNLSFEALISELQSMNKRVAFRLDVEKEMSFAFQLEGIKSIRAEQ